MSVASGINKQNSNVNSGAAETQPTPRGQNKMATNPSKTGTELTGDDASSKKRQKSPTKAKTTAVTSAPGATMPT